MSKIASFISLNTLPFLDQHKVIAPLSIHYDNGIVELQEDDFIKINGNGSITLILGSQMPKNGGFLSSLFGTPQITIYDNSITMLKSATMTVIP